MRIAGDGSERIKRGSQTVVYAVDDEWWIAEIEQVTAIIIRLRAICCKIRIARQEKAGRLLGRGVVAPAYDLVDLGLGEEVLGAAAEP